MKKHLSRGLVTLFLFLLMASFYLAVWVPRVQATYSVTIWAWDNLHGWLNDVTIVLDGRDIPYYHTPTTFTGLTGTHTFSVDDPNHYNNRFSNWDTGETDTTLTVSSAGTYTAQYYAPFSATIWSWDYVHGWLNEPIKMDGVSTGFNTPHTFTGLKTSHVFSTPSTNSYGNGFKQWNTGEINQGLLVTSDGTYTAQYYPPPYSATIWAWDNIGGYYSEPITMDGSSTGFNTPYTFTYLYGTHTFTVPITDSAGNPFSSWDTGETNNTITISSSGTYTAQYYKRYTVTIQAWDNIHGWYNTQGGIMDGSETFTAPHTFTDLTGTHTIRVFDYNGYGNQFKQWDTGETSTTITVSSDGTHTAQYYAPTPTPSPTPSPTPTPSPSSTPTPIPTATATPTPSPSPSPSPSPIPTASPTPSPTPSPSPSPSPTPTPTSSPTPTPSSIPTPIPTATATPTPSPSPSPSPSPIPTASPTPSPTPSPSPSPSPTPTPTPSPTPTPTQTPTPTPTPTSPTTSISTPTTPATSAPTPSPSPFHQTTTSPSESLPTPNQTTPQQLESANNTIIIALTVIAVVAIIATATTVVLIKRRNK